MKTVTPKHKITSRIFYCRHKAPFPPIRPRCSHQKSGQLKCNSLTSGDVYDFHKLFYSNTDSKFQDNFILKHMQVNAVARQRVKPDNLKTKRASHSTKYFVRTQQKELVRVCLEAFLKILHVSRAHLNTLSEQYYQKGVCKDHRGGFRQHDKYKAQKKDIVSFIKSQYPVKESHYCRGKTKRCYLPPELNIEMMYRQYRDARKDTSFHKVKSSYFRFVFSTEFNLGFGLPASDVCSLCSSFKERIKASRS